MALCLLIEDDPAQRALLKELLVSQTYQVIEAGSGASGLELAQRFKPDAIILDLGLPDGDGSGLIAPVLAADPWTVVIVLTGDDSARTAVDALGAGARHYLVKPVEHDELLLVLKRELALSGTREARARRESGRAFWGANLEMSRLRRVVERLAESPRTSVLISGETGSGKEVIALELHEATGCQGPFVPLNCAAIPDGLLESELFGHESGAFTGAGKRRRGLAELADSGTLFLDEISEMAPRLQAKLLRFLQDGSFRPVGGEMELKSTCRVIAATNLELSVLRDEKPLREDLFFRLAVVTLSVPPLRQRSEDIPALSSFLLDRLASELGRKPARLSARALAALLAHSWPGNVRELRNRLERAMVLCQGTEINPEDLDLKPWNRSCTTAIHALEDPAQLHRLLQAEGGNISAVARRLGVPRHLVRYRARRLRTMLNPR
ncbi:MAG: sigma-54-dependent Fis family transcriptional regulator [Acidobacteria bacterium]|nr:sigma-54-dependent Fis family transcriptional regulator [Acidobacteriota bacterium]